jgi:hypothetical protein
MYRKFDVTGNLFFLHSVFFVELNTAEDESGVFVKFFGFDYCSTFVCICQVVSNHELIRLKRFVSWFSTKLCN